MGVIHIKTNPNYPVIIEKGMFKKLGESLKPFIKGKVMIITDENVHSYYVYDLLDQMNKNGIKWEMYIISPGEESKSLKVYSEILEFMAENNIQRKDTVLAFGGGVVGDISGFVAGTFLRGIEYIQVPTTLLAAVDSSVGGKTAVNLKKGKNLVGIFNQPKAVLCDPDLLSTMEEKYFQDGVSESIKYGILFDKELFDEFQTPLDKKDERLSNIIEKCVEHKARVVEADELEKEERQILNLGHTIGHAIEKASDFKISHGHGVSIGTAMMARACEKLNILDKSDLKKIIEVLQKNGLPTQWDYSIEGLLNHIGSDKKRSGEEITIVEIKGIGKCRLNKIPINSFKDYVEKGME